MKAQMFFDISSMRFNPQNGLVKINDGLLFITDSETARERFYSKNIISEYGNSIKRHAANSVFGYSDIQLSQSGIITEAQFQKEYLDAFEIRSVYMQAFISFSWFIKDNSVGLLGTFGEIPDMRLVNGKSRSIVSYNCKGEIEETEFSQEELTSIAELTMQFNGISPIKPVLLDSTSTLYQYQEGKPIKAILPRTPQGFNYNAQNNIDRAINFLVIARNQNYLVYKIAYYMPIFECLFSTKGSEITLRIAIRAAFYIGESPKEQGEIFDAINEGYNIRSRFIHGQEFTSDGDIDKEILLPLSMKIDNYLRRIFIKVINIDWEIFIKYKTIERDDYLNKLAFGLPFDHEAVRENIKKREDDRRKQKEKDLFKAAKREAQNKKTI